MSTMSFKDKVVIVTGSSSGIGADTALLFAKLSANVVITGRSETKLKQVAGQFEKIGKKPLVIQADLVKDSDVKKIIDETIREFGQIDILVNNAGVGVQAGIQDGIEFFDRMISINLRSVHLLTSLAVPYLIKTKGSIVNVSTVGAVKPHPLFLNYCVAKAGLDMFTKCIAKELSVHGIRVNSVNPGPVKSGFQTAAGIKEEEVDGFIQAFVDISPLGLIPTTDDVAELIAFLAGDKARSITGSINFIDAGFLVA